MIETMGKKCQKEPLPEQETLQQGKAAQEAADACSQSETTCADAEAADRSDELTRLQEELASQKDLLLRTAAEFDNYKKRTAREMERIGAESRARVVKELLPAMDNFLRAQENGEAAFEDYKKGVDMSIKQLVELLSKLGLEEIKAQGETFDPNIHYAVARVEDENADENTVVQVMQKGYRMGDIVLRPAMVAVANC